MDKENNGLIEPEHLVSVLCSIGGKDKERYHALVSNLKIEPITQKVRYLDLLKQVSKLGSSNPFKTMVQKIELFMKSNKISTRQFILKAGATTSEDGVSIEKLASFLKKKVDKGQSLESL